MISVIIPTYQHAKTIGPCLDAVFAQTLPPGEVIVVNDGSTDGTEETLKPYLSRIKLVTQENRGSNFARNRGLGEAKGEFVVFCDADVRMRPDMLEKLSQALGAHPEASYAYSAFKFGWKTFGGIPFDAARMRERNFVHTTCLVRRAAFPGFDEGIKRLQDWDVWLTMLAEGKTGILVPDVLFAVAVEGTSRIGSSWLPQFMYRIPWAKLGWTPQVIRKYEASREIIRKKHGL